MKNFECPLAKADGHYYYGLVLLDANAFEEADAAFARALKLNPFHTECLFWRTQVARIQGNSTQETDRLLDLICIEPENSQTYLALSVRQLEQGNREVAFQNFSRFVSLRKTPGQNDD